MNSVGRPQVGDWYQNPDQGQPFQVVSVDAATDTVQVQSFDGELDSIDTEDWEQMPLVTAAAPEDWTGSVDDVEPDEVSEDDSPSDRGARVGGTEVRPGAQEDLDPDDITEDDDISSDRTL